MTEYISEGTGDHANNSFNDMVKNQVKASYGKYNDYKTVDWFIQAMTTKNWRFYYDGVNVVD